MSLIRQQLQVRMPRSLFALAIAAAVIGSVAVINQPRSSEAEVASGNRGSGDFRLVCTVNTSQHRVEVMGDPRGRLIYLVYDSEDRAVGAYHSLAEASSRFSDVRQAAFDGAFAEVPASLPIFGP